MAQARQRRYVRVKRLRAGAATLAVSVLYQFLP